MILDELPDGRPGKSLPRSHPNNLTRKQLGLMVRRVPEVMVKVSRSSVKDIHGNVSHPSPRNMKSLAGLVKYIGRDGLEEITDEQGNKFTGIEAKKEAISGWESMPETGGTRAEAFHIVLSMPAGTDRIAVAQAVEAFAGKKFEGHQYLIAHHDDQPRPHSHIVLKIESIDGSKRLNPRKAILQEWRECFAEELQWQGVEANATSRLARLSTRRSLDQGAYRYHEQQRNGNANADLNRRLHQPLSASQNKTLVDYRAIAAELMKGPESDKQLGERLVNYLAKQIGHDRSAQPEQNNVPVQESGVQAER